MRMTASSRMTVLVGCCGPNRFSDTANTPSLCQRGTSSGSTAAARRAGRSANGPTPGGPGGSTVRAPGARAGVESARPTWPRPPGRRWVGAGRSSSRPATDPTAAATGSPPRRVAGRTRGNPPGPLHGSDVDRREGWPNGWYTTPVRSFTPPHGLVRSRGRENGTTTEPDHTVTGFHGTGTDSSNVRHTTGQCPVRVIEKVNASARGSRHRTAICPIRARVREDFHPTELLLAPLRRLGLGWCGYQGHGLMPAPDLAVGRTHLWRPARIVARHAARPPRASVADLPADASRWLWHLAAMILERHSVGWVRPLRPNSA